MKSFSVSLVVFTSLLLFAVLAYFPSLQAPFVFDDVFLLEFNRGIRNFRNLSLLVFGGESQTRPLANFVSALNYAWGGLDPLSFRWTNLVLHSLAAWAVFLCVSTYTTRFLAVVCALLFLVHPLNSESVLLITARSGILVGLFTFLCLYFFDRARSEWNVWMGFALLSALMAGLSKESAVMIPAILLVWSMGIRNQKLSKWHLVVGLICTLPILLLLSLKSPHKDVIGFEVMPAGPFYCSQAKIFWLYLFKLIWPQSLIIWLERTTFATCDSTFLLALAGLALGLAVLIRSKRWRSSWLHVLLLFELPLLPTTLVPRLDLYGERLLYSSLGLLLIAATTLMADNFKLNLIFERNRKIFSGIFVILIAALGWRTYLRAEVWAQPSELWAKSARQSPSHTLVRLNSAISRVGQPNSNAMQELEALTHDPENAGLAHYHLAVRLLLENKIEEGLVQLQLAIEKSKESARMATNAARFFIDQKRFDLARKFIDQALAIDSEYATAVTMESLYYLVQEKWEHGLASAERAIAIDPYDAAARVNEAIALLQLNRIEEAQEGFKEALWLDLRQSDARKGLARTLIMLGDKKAARSEYLKVLKVNPQDEEAQTAAENLQSL